MSVQEQVEAGLSHHRAGRLADAERIYRQILAQDPNNVDALHLLGALAGQVGQRQAAVDLMRRAIQLKPDLAAAHSNLGNILREMDRLDEAIESFRHAIRLQPGFADAHNNLGLALKSADRLDEAIAAYQEAIRLQPDLAPPHSNLGGALLDRGEHDQAIYHFRRGHELKPDDAVFHSDLVYALHYHPGYDARMIHEEHRLWNQRHALGLKKLIEPHTNDRDPQRRLRIGYVSPHFTSSHVVGRSLLRLLHEHDREQVMKFCYADAAPNSEGSEQFRQRVDVWRGIKGLTDLEAADLIRKDRIDILVDLSMHSDGSRLMIFARKPAPVQVTYLGYCGSTGLEAIDYRLSDPHIDPPGSDLSVYSEQTLQLADTYWCYDAPAQTPEPSPLPAASAGHITFGCLNNFAKASLPAQNLWIEILKAAPRSRLIIHAFPGIHRDILRKRFADKGVSPDRIEFFGKQPWAQYVGTYGRIDIGLDPFPWGGGITTCDAIWMGVPVVTLAGQTAVGRGGKSILTNIGVPELIAQTPEQYVQIATALANDIPRLTELRSSLRQRMKSSPLMDPPRFARSIEAAYRKMWQTWCATGDTIR